MFLIVPIGLSQFPHKGDPEKTPPLVAMQKQMGLERLNGGVFFIAIVMWGVIFGSLLFGLFAVIWQLVLSSQPNPEISKEVWDWRFSLAKLAALTATLGAVVALPFTLVRLGLNRKQTETATEALFNDKIDNAVSDLHAQRQVTKWLDGIAQNGWEDDVTRRNGAIDRLLGLAMEEREAAPRIARMLSVYVKELTREFPAKTAPETDDPEILREWTLKLQVARSDMQNAVQVLGRLRTASGLELPNSAIDLTGVNLQGFDLSDLNFEVVSFKNAQLQGADLSETRLKEANFNHSGLQGADFFKAQLQGATLFDTPHQMANFFAAQLKEANLSFVQWRGADLKHAEMQGADLISAQLLGADLRYAEFDKETNLTVALLRGAAVSDLDFTDVSIEPEQLQKMFGDASVILPDGHGPEHENWPEHWSKKTLEWDEFETQWRAFQHSIGQDPYNPE